MQDNSLWPQADLSVDDFSLSSHRQIFRRMAAMFEDQQPVDNVTLTLELHKANQLAACGDAAYLTDLLTQGLPANFPKYVQEIREAAQKRRINRLKEQLIDASEPDVIRDITENIQNELSGRKSQRDWRSLFHTREEVENAPPLSFAIDGFLQEEGITLLGALPGHGKTLTMLAMVRALLEGGKLFTKFEVKRRAERVLYLIPECGIGPFTSRVKMCRLDDYIGTRFFYQTLSSKEPFALTDSRLLKAVEGADVFLDTASRFMEGDESAMNAELRIFAQNLFNLQRAGARTITGAHHSTKNSSTQDFMTLENVLRGSGDIGALACTVWGLKQIDLASNSIYIANVKPRDFEPCEPFVITGRPCLDQTGYFEMTEPPGFAKPLSEYRNGGRPQTPEKDEKVAEALRLRDQGMSFRDIGAKLGAKVPTLHSWLNPK